MPRNQEECSPSSALFLSVETPIREHNISKGPAWFAASRVAHHPCFLLAWSKPQPPLGLSFTAVVSGNHIGLLFALQALRRRRSRVCVVCSTVTRLSVSTEKNAEHSRSATWINNLFSSKRQNHANTNPSRPSLWHLIATSEDSRHFIKQL